MKNDCLYLIALGSNQRHPLLGKPADILEHAIAALEMQDLDIFSQSKITTSRPIGPSQRNFANSAALISTKLNPDELLTRLQQVERHFGRRSFGQRWRERVLDLDIILWTGGIWISDHPALTVPHPSWQTRRFVLQPAAEIAPHMRDPITGLNVMQLLYQFNRPKRVDRGSKRH